MSLSVDNQNRPEPTSPSLRIRELPDPLFQEESADLLSMRSLLNCYTREEAAPKGFLRFEMPEDVLDYPEDLLHLARSCHLKIVRIRLSNSLREIIAPCTEPSLTGTLLYFNPIYVLDTRSTTSSSRDHWTRLNASSLAHLIANDLSQAYHCRLESDFLVQIQDSARVLERIIEPKETSSVPSFIETEQSVIYGHPFHPSPKSRLDFTEEEVRNYSPEFRSHFQLHYFLIHRDCLIHDSLLPLPTDQLLASHIPEVPHSDPDFAWVPTHPWEAKYLLRMPEIQKAIQEGKVKNHGPLGYSHYPTASIRTLFCPELDYFYKMSLHVRITNCIRRNAVSEIQSALAITRLLRNYQDWLRIKHPSFTALEESAYLSVNLPCENPTAQQRISEGFGMLLREGFQDKLQKDTVPVIAAFLFGNQRMGRSWLSQTLPTDELRMNWWNHYLELLLPPFLDLYFKWGIMFEPHLQNTLIGLKDGVPTQIFIRDFDNVRILEGSPVALDLEKSDPHLYSEVLYTQEQGRNRFLYCLVVNHLCEAIYQLAFQNPQLERKLWDDVRGAFLNYADRECDKAAQQEIQHWIFQSRLPAKANLLTRFQRTPDQQASYVGILNPMASI